MGIDISLDMDIFTRVKTTLLKYMKPVKILFVQNVFTKA